MAYRSYCLVVPKACPRVAAAVETLGIYEFPSRNEKYCVLFDLTAMYGKKG